MKYVIEPIHLGRYRFSVMDKRTPDSNYEVVSVQDGGSAFIMIMLNEVIFKPEHRQYQQDQRTSSDQLGREAICRLEEDFKPKKLIPKRS